jgi:Spt5 transcription elongation factor, acidic N-terminal
MALPSLQESSTVSAFIEFLCSQRSVEEGPRRTVHHARLDRHDRELNVQDLARIAEDVSQRYKRAAVRYTGDMNKVPQRLLMPSVQDTNDQDLAHIAEDVSQRYKRAAIRYTGDINEVPQRLLMQVEATRIWTRVEATRIWMRVEATHIWARVEATRIWAASGSDLYQGLGASLVSTTLSFNCSSHVFCRKVRGARCEK